MDYQAYLAAVVRERGFEKETPDEVFMLLAEEVGELAKAIRKSSGRKTYKDSKHRDLEEEAADVLFMLLDLSNRLNIDLEKAFRAKETKNTKRQTL